MNRVVTVLILLGLNAVISGLKAQAPASAYAPAVALRGPAELDQLVGPIALYPDPLIAELLPAATQPAQIVVADRYLSQGADINQVDLQPWDQSVKALARYSTVLRWMDENLAWTTELGQAFLYQQADVMNAIQRLRIQALSLGNLQSTPQQTVLSDNGVIEIVPANPQVVYVPVYQPQVVYVQPPPRPGAFISFGAGLPTGLWLNHDFDWRRHDIIVWHRDHPRPPDWWRLPPSRRPFEIERAPVTVWQPRAQTVFSDRERESRGWAPAVARPEYPTPRVEPRPAIRPPEPEHRPANGREMDRPAPRSFEPPAERRIEPARQGIAPPVSRTPSGALIGSRSTPEETHQYSVRGQTSRQEIQRPPSPAGTGRPEDISGRHEERNRR